MPGQPLPKQRPVWCRGRARSRSRDLIEEDRLRSHLFVAMGRRPPASQSISLRINFRRSGRIAVDLDNLIKMILDASNRILWEDDRQIVAISATKTLGCRKPRTRIYIRERKSK